MIKAPRHPARERHSLASAVLVAACLLSLAACETPGIGGLGYSAEDRAERMAQNGEHAAAASAYMGLAVDAAGTERDRLTLLAVEQYLDAGDVSRARSAFGNVPRQETGDLAALWRTNRAAFHLYQGEADASDDETRTLVIEDVPAGTYDGFSFTYGVPEERVTLIYQGTDIATFTSDEARAAIPALKHGRPFEIEPAGDEPDFVRKELS